MERVALITGTVFAAWAWSVFLPFLDLGALEEGTLTKAGTTSGADLIMGGSALWEMGTDPDGWEPSERFERGIWISEVADKVAGCVGNTTMDALVSAHMAAGLESWGGAEVMGTAVRAIIFPEMEGRSTGAGVAPVTGAGS